MDCPYCREENLLGAKICALCGRNMVSAPPAQAGAGVTHVRLPALEDEPDASAGPDDAPSAPAKHAAELPPAASAPVQAICRVCTEGFDRRPDETGVPICPGCRQFAPVPGGDASVNEVAIHPATQVQPGVDPRSGSAIPRLKPVVRRASLRTGPVIAVAGLVLGLVGVGVVTISRREKDPAAEYLGDVKREGATFAVTPSTTDVARIETTLSLSLVREAIRGSFGSGLDTVLDLRQKSVQTTDVAWVREESRGMVIDAAGECRVAEQSGKAPNGDGREARAYPWEGHRATLRLLVAPQAPTQTVDGQPVVSGRDVPPCFTLHDIGVPAGAVAAGASWKAGIAFPLLMTRDGALRPVAFPCDVTYAGRITRNGVPSYLFSVRGAAPQGAAGVIDDMNRTAGTIRGAVFFDATTGLVAEAHVKADVSAWLDRGRVEDRVRVAGTLDIRRR